MFLSHVIAKIQSSLASAIRTDPVDTTAQSVRLMADSLKSGTAVLVPQSAVIDYSTSGDKTVVAAVVGKAIMVLQYELTVGGDVTLTWKSASTKISGGMPYKEGGGISSPFIPIGIRQTAAGEALVLTISAGVQVGGSLKYVEV